MSSYSKPCVLVTGFTPFGGESINPSWQLAQLLEGETIEGHLIHTKELPCEFDKSIESLTQAIDKYHPSIVICLGQAGGRCDISIERIAINVNDARIADNAGNQPIDTPVVTHGPDAYFASLPIKSMLSSALQAGVPASISNTAGTYVCNHVMYGLLHYLSTHDLACRGGFVHIPYLPSQAAHHPGAPSMDIDTLVKGIKILLTSAITQKQDIKLVAGTTH
ncbi:MULTISPECIES: pyroglutamyl-peptidase I [Pseudoalteromonas]|uniref:Pyrrolidone-carboxylate peptidase n=2 Tax=Pseudoalteromonas TaxID=53246 RepID=A0A8I2KJW2_9GAMM|nr:MULTISPECIES: pyroglutamyl-peptidase I [Pseudoalteromonas]ATD06601.1 pyroglutamyl-peptidase [Pseudoalteromonas piscicida]KJZ04398.1 pyrrolidone-carboxylate peptidase [Pseudoalteromonas piscicida]NLR20360.1 pyroglutamyl-peptidase I [Pseudoalteromonas maricaloris]QUI63691.1 pyroglutamyl-peptidase I [Pseudoalteromonas sp. A22]QZO11423.1 pyroglutamyl-peptidase I [Pseudoalteromonas piscicida]